jgi:hypothetical protein
MTTQQEVWSDIMSHPPGKPLTLSSVRVGLLQAEMREVRRELIEAHRELHRQAVVLAHYEDEAVWRAEE